MIVIASLSSFLNGGKGSGNWGHSGRPGQVGGSGKGAGLDPMTSARLSKLYRARSEASTKAADTYHEELAWAMYMTLEEKAARGIAQTFKNEFEKQGLEIHKVVKAQLDWAEGNGPRDTKTGEYLSTPTLQAKANTPEMRLHRKLTQETLRAAGYEELTLYRGIRDGEPEARGYTSFTTSKAVASTFGGKVVQKKVKLKDIVSHHQVHWTTTYLSEQEVIVDLH